MNNTLAISALTVLTLVLAVCNKKAEAPNADTSAYNMVNRAMPTQSDRNVSEH